MHKAKTSTLTPSLALIITGVITGTLMVAMASIRKNDRYRPAAPPSRDNTVVSVR